MHIFGLGECLDAKKRAKYETTKSEAPSRADHFKSMSKSSSEKYHARRTKHQTRDGHALVALEDFLRLLQWTKAVLSHMLRGSSAGESLLGLGRGRLCVA